MRLRYTDRAKEDLELAFLWYEQQRVGLGHEFLNCVEAGIEGIISNPTLYRCHYGRFRGCVIRRFPFVIFYSIEPDELVIHSIFNSRQDPANRP